MTGSRRTRLAVLTSHPIQYYAPLFRELARRFDVHVFFAHRATAEQQAAAGFGVAFDWDVDLLSGYAHSFLRNVSARPGTDRFSGCDTPEIGARLKEGGFDALLVMGWNLKSFLQGVFAAKRLGIPVMVRGDSHLATPRSSLKRRTKQLAYPVFLRLFDAALYVGSRNRMYFEHYRYPRDRLFFSPHCVDTKWYGARATAVAGAALRAGLGIGAETKIVLFAGKLMPFKRPLDVIAAVAALRAQDWPIHIMVAGAGDLAGEMTRTAASEGVPLSMLGFCNQSEMPAVYAAADCLVLPSNARETWGLVANEALACTRPVVLSEACGAAPDLAADGHAGRVFPMGDVPALAATLASLLGNPPAPEAIAAKSRSFSVEAAADGIALAIRRCHGQSAASGETF
jgi:glycosyltransferase involved in cell wall biosynthesis